MRRNTETPTIRHTLADVVTQGLEELEPALAPDLTPDVRSLATELSDDLDKYLLDVQLDHMAPGRTAGNRRAHTLFLDVISCHQESTDAHEDELDALASAVLDVLTENRATSWTACQRVVRDELFPAYRITVTMEDRG